MNMNTDNINTSCQQHTTAEPRPEIEYAIINVKLKANSNGETSRPFFAFVERSERGIAKLACVPVPDQFFSVPRIQTIYSRMMNNI